MYDRTRYKEWFFQSDYDLDTADDMLKSGRNVYAVFMCHLSLEKALKGLIVKQTGEFPAKTHSLVYLANKLNIDLSENQEDFIHILNKISVPTRYPDDLRKLFTAFTQKRTSEILTKTKNLQSWIKQQ